MAGKICRPNPLVVVQFIGQNNASDKSDNYNTTNPLVTQFIGLSDIGCEASNDIITQLHNDYVIPRTKHSVSKKENAPLRGLSSMHLVHIMQVRH